MSNESKNLMESLINQNVKRSKIGRIRERLDEIEDAQRKGIRNIDLVSALNAEGLNLTLKTFENMLHRIRKEREEKGEIKSPEINNRNGNSIKASMKQSAIKDESSNRDLFGRESYPFIEVTDERMKEWDDMNLPKLAKGLLIRYGVSKEEFYSLNITVTSPTSINEIISTYCKNKEQLWINNR